MAFSKKLESLSANELLAAEKAMSLRLTELIGELHEADLEVGSNVLDRALSESPAIASNTVTKQALALRSELAGCRAAIDAVRRQRIEAVPRDAAAEAAQLRNQITRKREELAALVAAVQKALAPITSLEGFEFRPSDLIDGARARGAGGLSPMTKSETLETEIIDLDRAARVADARMIRQSGTLTGKSLEEVLPKLFDDAAVLAPTFEAVQEWAELIEERLCRSELGTAGDTNEQRLYSIQFDHGRILPALSKLTFGSYGPAGSTRPREYTAA